MKRGLSKNWNFISRYYLRTAKKLSHSDINVGVYMNTYLPTYISLPILKKCLSHIDVLSLCLHTYLGDTSNWIWYKKLTFMLLEHAKICLLCNDRIWFWSEAALLNAKNRYPWFITLFPFFLRARAIRSTVVNFAAFVNTGNTMNIVFQITETFVSNW